MTDDRGRGRGGRSQQRGPNRPGGPTDGPIPAFDLYAVVGVRPDATRQEIVEAIAALDRRLRTAAAKDRPGATARLKRLNVARHWLTDSARRRTYDAAIAGGAAGAAGRVRGRVGAGSATRRSGGTGPGAWLNQPLTWAGIAVVAVIAAFLVLRPGGFGGGASAGASASAVARGSGCPTSQPPALGAGQKRLVTIATAKGSIGITIDADLSPIAAGNFVALASCGFYDGVVFHRVATLQDGTPFVIQGGDPTGTGSGGPGYEIQDEPVKTAYKRGTVAMARSSAPNSVGSQFFIVLDDKDAPVLSSANTYQIIGSVTSGMETADAIYAAAGGVEIPPSPIKMDKVTVTTP